MGLSTDLAHPETPCSFEWVGTPNQGGSHVDTQAFSITQFCTTHGISRALFYLLVRDGTAPATMVVRGRRLITAESARLWREQMTVSTAKRKLTPATAKIAA